MNWLHYLKDLARQPIQLTANMSYRQILIWKDVTFSAIGGGTTPTPFLGTFDGNGYTISNLKIESANGSTGFFAYIGTGGSVENLKLVNADIVGQGSTGAIAGTSTGTIENTYVDGKITGKSNTGGIVGTLHAGTLQNSTVNAEVYGHPVGGLIGGTNWNGSGSPLIVKDTTTGNVILNNLVMGTVSGPADGNYIGAVVGDMGGSSGSLLQTFTGNAVTNEVSGATPGTGKIAGYWSGSRPIIDTEQNNYYDSDKLSTDGLPSGIAATFTGKTTTDFAQKATFENLGWDFNNVWDWDATNNVPVNKTFNVDGGDEDNVEPIIPEKIYDYKNYKTGKLMIHDQSVSVTLDAASDIKNGVVFTGGYAEFHGEGFANQTVTLNRKMTVQSSLTLKGPKLKEVIIEGSNVEIRGDENVQVITNGKKAK